MIYIDILPVSLLVTTLGISSVPFLFSFLRQFLKVVIMLTLDHKLYFGFSAAMIVCFQLMHCLTCFMSSILLLYLVPYAVRHSTGSLLILRLLSFRF